MSSTLDFSGQYQIAVHEVPSAPGKFDYWIFLGADPDAIHHGAGYSSRAEARNAAKIWIDQRRRGFK
jgi:hypothetical protein